MSSAKQPATHAVLEMYRRLVALLESGMKNEHLEMGPDRTFVNVLMLMTWQVNADK